MSRHAIGIDIGGTNTKIGLITENGELLDFTKFPTTDHPDFVDFSKMVYQESHALLDKNKIAYNSLVGIGVGAPNGNSKTGFLQNPPNLKQWGNAPLIQEFTRFFGKTIPLHLDNDANVAAIGERLWGAGQNIDDFIVVTLGTGTGTGVFCNGQIVRGANGMATEGGHICIIPNGRSCNCGGQGHLEAYASVRGIKLTTYEIVEKELRFAEILERFQGGDDEKIKLIVSKTAEYLALGLANMANLLAPNKFILAGGVAMLGDEFLSMVQREFEQLVFGNFRGDTQIAISQISTSEGAVLGAAGLAFHFA